MFSAMTAAARCSGLAVRCSLLAAAIAVPAYADGATCDSLKALTRPDATVDSVQVVAAGTFTQPGARAGRGSAMADLPAFCRVAITSRPSSDSDIKIEVWLPAENWNQKYQAVGNGAWTGSIGYAAMADALRRGYATSSTDTGHVGGKDGLISNPSACRFDPAALQCKGAASDDCLTAAQVAEVKTIYSPLKLKSHETAGLAYGSELNWTPQGWSAGAQATGLDHYRYFVYSDPEWPVSKFDAASDPAKLEGGLSGEIDARSPDLKAFFSRGRKLLMYHGWADPQISPFNATTYYEQVVKAAGGAGKISGSYRLFMAPGMAHCGGGEGPNDFDKIGTLEQWVEKGKAPDQIVASHTKGGAVDRTRPLCPYPQIATYKGSGSVDEAASFACK